LKKIAVYFGSFNPFHNGHLAIVRFFAQQKVADELWLMVSPHNPLKNLSELAPEQDRLVMAQLAVANIPEVKVCDIEFTLPKPSYTIDTMRHLQQSFPDVEWLIILGEDSMVSFPRWKKYEELLSDFEILLFPREGERASLHLTNNQKSVRLFPAPLIPISSTEVRKRIAEHLPYEDLIQPQVASYIRSKALYL